jgi:hypothetical protein
MVYVARRRAGAVLSLLYQKSEWSGCELAPDRHASLDGAPQGKFKSRIGRCLRPVDPN